MRLELCDGWVALGTGEVHRAGRVVRLTTKELELLVYLTGRAGQDVATEALLTDVWGYAPSVVTRAPFHTMRRLRAKVEADPSAPRHLLTVHGVGYRFQPGTEAAPASTADPLVGRQAERVALDRILAAGARCVTLVGPAGAGKTTLATAWAARSGRVTRTCEVESARDAAALIHLVGQALGVDPVEEASTAVVAALRALGPCVLVLDNLEQVVEPAAHLVRAWLEQAPELCILGTSRTPLGLAAEHLLRVPPLAPHTDGAELFALRARQVRHDFVLDAHTRPAVQAVVRCLDGLPLAIELAAARVRALSLEALLQQLRSTPLGLRSRRRDRPVRQQTLEGALRWSWDLLDPPQRSALERCAVFAGPFSLDAAEATGVALEDLDALVDHSLVVPELDAPTPTFRLLVTVRAFVRARMDAPDALYALHGRWFSRHGDADAIARLDADHGALRERVLAEVPDLVEAATRDPVGAVGALCCLVAVSADQHGLADLVHRARAGLRQRARALAFLPMARLELSVSELEADARTSRGTLRAFVCLHLADVHERGGRDAQALAAFGSAVDAAADAPSLRGAAWARRAALHRRRGDFEPARADLVHARRSLESVADDRGLAQAVLAEGNLLFQTGDPVSAEAAYRRGLQAVGPQSVLATMFLANLGMVVQRRGQLDQARALYRQAAEAARRRGDALREGLALSNLGTVERDAGELAVALNLLADAAALLDGVGSVRSAALATVNLSLVHLSAREWSAARRTASDALRRLEDVGDQRLCAVADAVVVVAGPGLDDEARARLARALGAVDGQDVEATVWLLAAHAGARHGDHALLRQGVDRARGCLERTSDGGSAADRAELQALAARITGS